MTTRNTKLMATEVAEHIAADAVIQGTYWNANEHKGCFIGCLGHSDDPAVAVKRFGLTLPLLRIAENIFEALPADEAKDFFAAFPEAVGCDGKDLSRVHWQFLASELRALPVVPADVQAVIDPVIAGMDLLASSQEWPAKVADAATWAAKAAAWAAEAAWAATWAATWAARAAWAACIESRRRQRDTLLHLISQAPVLKGTDEPTFTPDEIEMIAAPWSYLQSQEELEGAE